MVHYLLSPAQTDWQVLVSRKFPRKYAQVAKKKIIIIMQTILYFDWLIIGQLMDVTQLALIWVQWPKNKFFALRTNLIWTKVSASHRKSTKRTQCLAKQQQERLYATPFGQGFTQTGARLNAIKGLVHVT